MIVVDASVVVKTYLDEAGSEEATTLVSGPHELLAPSLIRLEVAAAICRRVRRGEMEPGDGKMLCDHWQKRLTLGLITLTPDEVLLGDAVELANTLKHPLQDCLYLAAARRSGAALITADRQFHDRAKPVFGKISLLAGCEGN